MVDLNSTKSEVDLKGEAKDHPIFKDYIKNNSYLNFKNSPSLHDALLHNEIVTTQEDLEQKIFVKKNNVNEYYKKDWFENKYMKNYLKNHKNKTNKNERKKKDGLNAEEKVIETKNVMHDVSKPHSKKSESEGNIFVINCFIIIIIIIFFLLILFLIVIVFIMISHQLKNSPHKFEIAWRESPYLKINYFVILFYLLH